MTDDVLSFFKTNTDCQSVRNVIEENILTNEGLNHSIELLNLTLSTQSDSLIKQFTPLISVTIGVVLGFLSNRLHWEYTEKKKKEKDSFEKISNLIGDIETLAVEYWIKDHDDEDTKNEVYIKSKTRLLSKYIRNIKLNNHRLKVGGFELTTESRDTRRLNDVFKVQHRNLL